MNIISSDQATLALAGQPVAGLTRRQLTLQRRVGDKTSASDHGWQSRETLQHAAYAELRADGIFVSSSAMNAVRDAFFDGTTMSWSLSLPGEGIWTGSFVVPFLEFSGVAEKELNFKLRLMSTDILTFNAE